MKQLRRVCRIAALAAAAVAVAAAAGCYDSSEPPQKSITGTQRANISIAGLVSLYRGGTVTITENMIIEGRVTTSDRAGNFYRSFFVEQDSCAVEILAGLTDLHNVWPAGSRVSVRLQGLAMSESEGVKQIGLPAAEYQYGTLTAIPSREELDARIVRTDTPQPFGIANCYASMLRMEMCGRLMRVVSLVRTPEQASPDLVNRNATDPDDDTWGGYHIFFDNEDSTPVAVRVSDHADFASHPVLLPDDKTFAVAGIVMYGRPEGADSEMFIIKPRNEEDVLY